MRRVSDAGWGRLPVGDILFGRGLAGRGQTDVPSERDRGPGHTGGRQVHRRGADRTNSRFGVPGLGRLRGRALRLAPSVVSGPCHSWRTAGGTKNDEQRLQEQDYEGPP